MPFFRVFTPEGEWRVENEGVAPDVEVPLDPLAVNAGNDVQLDAAIADVLQQLKNAPEIPRKTRAANSGPSGQVAWVTARGEATHEHGEQ